MPQADGADDKEEHEHVHRDEHGAHHAVEGLLVARADVVGRADGGGDAEAERQHEDDGRDVVRHLLRAHGDGAQRCDDERDDAEEADFAQRGDAHGQAEAEDAPDERANGRTQRGELNGVAPVRGREAHDGVEPQQDDPLNDGGGQAAAGAAHGGDGPPAEDEEEVERDVGEQRDEGEHEGGARLAEALEVPLHGACEDGGRGPQHDHPHVAPRGLGGGGVVAGQPGKDEAAGEKRQLGHDNETERQ